MALTPLRPTDPPSYGPYRLQGRLGAGGMGVVYLAFGPDNFSEGVSDGSAVALKVLQPALAQDEEFRQRFVREVNTARRVSSPHVARVVGAETDGDPLWMATEYIEGATLSHAMETHGPIPEDRLRGLAADLARAIASMHEVGLIHRDMKPANVVLAWSGPKLIDFGIAKDEGSTELTQVGMAVGSPMWMSPEVLSGAPATAASDIFGWGMCVASAGTGRPPFGVGHPNAVSYRILNAQPDISGLTGPLAAQVAAALSKNPADRPTASQLAKVLGPAGLETTAVAVPRADGGWTGPNRLQGGPGGPGGPGGLGGHRGIGSFGSIDGNGGNGGDTRQGEPAQKPEKKPSRRVLLFAVAAVVLVAAGVLIALLATSGDKNNAGPHVGPSGSPSTGTPVLAPLSQAEALVRDDGYTPFDDDAATWDPSAPINVILATKTGSADGYNQWAYFFAGTDYIGHDSVDPSLGITVSARTKTQITLAYQLYAPKDPLCCPTAPTQTVRFSYFNGVFKTLDPIPTTDPTKNHR